MGNIRVPKTIYKNGMVLEFYTINKEIFYHLLKWNKEGTNLALIQNDKLGDRSPSQIFTNVGVEQ